jgi:ABC-type transport system involved in multi-copper enzyme maturation permease subunit
MIGTIVHQELLLGGRRNRLHYVRWAYGTWLILQVFLFYTQYLAVEQRKQFIRMQAAWMNGGVELAPLVPVSAPEVVGAQFAENFFTQQFILLAIATPALVAGAVTDEKRRGTLQYLLLTEFDSRQLLLGKLLGRVAQVAVLALIGLPLFALLGGFGGVQPLTFLAFLVLSALEAFAIAAAALLASVWCRQTRDAVLALYGVGVAAGLVVWRVGGVLELFNPYWALDGADSMAPAELFGRLGQAALAWGAVAVACMGLAVWRLKPTYLRELEGSPAKRSVWPIGRRKACDDQPVRWRECHVEGLSPVAGLRRVPQWLAVVMLALATTASSVLILTLTLTPGATAADVLDAARHLDFGRLEQLLPTAGSGFWIQGVVIMLLASLVVGIRCSGAVTGERERQTWEALLLTPLTARELIRGKLWGVMGASYAYLLACGVPAVTLSLVAGPLATFWTVLWLAVTVLAMYFVGAAGLWSSVQSKSSWQALLKTLAWGYLFGAVINFIASFIVSIILFMIVLLLGALDVRLKTAMARAFLNNLSQTANLISFAICIGLALSSWGLALVFLNQAQRRIAQRERTRHWRAAPVYRRAKRRNLPRRVSP